MAGTEGANAHGGAHDLLRTATQAMMSRYAGPLHMRSSGARLPEGYQVEIDVEIEVEGGNTCVLCSCSGYQFLV